MSRETQEDTSTHAHSRSAVHVRRTNSRPFASKQTGRGIEGKREREEEPCLSFPRCKRQLQAQADVTQRTLGERERKRKTSACNSICSLLCVHSLVQELHKRERERERQAMHFSFLPITRTTTTTTATKRSLDFPFDFPVDEDAERVTRTLSEQRQRRRLLHQLQQRDT